MGKKSYVYKNSIRSILDKITEFRIQGVYGDVFGDKIGGVLLQVFYLLILFYRKNFCRMRYMLVNGIVFFADVKNLFCVRNDGISQVQN